MYGGPFAATPAAIEVHIDRIDRKEWGKLLKKIKARADASVEKWQEQQAKAKTRNVSTPTASGGTAIEQYQRYLEQYGYVVPDFINPRNWYGPYPDEEEEDEEPDMMHQEFED